MPSRICPRSWLAIAVALGAVSCSDATTAAGGDASGADTTTPTETANYDAYIAAYASADCDRQVRCTTPSKYVTVDACMAAISPAIAIQRKHIGESVAAGKTSYDAAQAGLCLAAVRGSCSAATLSVLQACNPVIEGKVALGAACVGHFECLDTTPKDSGPYCFNGCTGLFGDQDPPPAGTCVAQSPITTPACKN